MAKTAAKTVSKLAVVPTSGDLVKQVAKEVEALTEAQAYKLAESLSVESAENAFKLGGVLARIQDAGWVGDHRDFRTLCEERFGVSYRTAAYTIKIYKVLVEIGVDWKTVKHLGWTRMRVLSTVLTEKNCAGWFAKAEKMTVLQLTEAVKKAKAKSIEANADEGETSTITTLTLKLHPDQKTVVAKALAKGKKELKTEFDSVALTNICTGYLGGTVEVPVSASDELPENPKEFKKLLTNVIAAAGYAAVLKQVSTAWPKLVLDVTVPESMREKKAA